MPRSRGSGAIRRGSRRATTVAGSVMAPSARTMSSSLTGSALVAGVVGEGVDGGCVLTGAVVGEDAEAVGGNGACVVGAAVVGAGTAGLADGDWSISRGWSEHPSAKWRVREALHSRTAFDRMEALGFRHLMPEGRRGRYGDVVTFKPIGKTPAEAWAQLDYVFATENIADRVSVRALNDPDDWGPSDHCRILIELD